MTMFEKDLMAAKEGGWLAVLTKRKAQLDRLVQEGRSCKNGFRVQCIVQDVARLQAEYAAIEEAVC